MAANGGPGVVLAAPIRQDEPLARGLADAEFLRTQSSHDLARVQRAASDAIAILHVHLNDGDELFRVLVRELGYGQADERLRAFIRVLQKRLEACR